MNNTLNLLIISLLLLLLSSCDSRKKQELAATERLKHIELLISENALNAAKIEIDSIHLLYPRLVEKRRIAAAFQDTITRRESARTLAYADSILPLKLHEADSLLQLFVFEKNEKYQEIGNFINKKQRIENNTNRNFLRAYVDENANLYLESTYTAAKIAHTAVKVSTVDLSVSSDSIPITSPANHNFSDGGKSWETVTFKNEEERGVVAFIAQYQYNTIKVSLAGTKSVSYVLSDTDKRAIAETYHLWIVKSDVAKLQKEITKANIRIERINARKKQL